MAFWDGQRWIRDPSVPTPHRRKVRDWIATSLAVIVLLGTMIPFSDLQAAAPSLVLQPGTAAAGSIVEARGNGFSKGAHVAIAFDGSQSPVTTARVSGNGTFRARFAVPQVVPGRYTMLAMQVPSASTRTSGASAIVASAFLVVGLTSPATGSPAPSVSATPAVAPSPTPRPTPSPTPTPSELPSPVPLPSATPLPTPTAQPTAAPPPPGAANPPIAGFVARSGTNLVLNGATYRFTGFNIYNANSRWNCWYPMVGGGLDRALRDIGGGQEVIRAWFFQPLATSNGRRDWTAFDATLATARARGVRVVATLTDHWGACESTGQKAEAWYTGGYRSAVAGGTTTSYREFVREVVSRYRGDPTVLMWQMVNEAESKTAGGGCSAGSVLRGFADDVGGLIRSIDANHLISLGTLGGSQCGIDGDKYRVIHESPFVDVCEFHDYEGNEPMPALMQTRINQCNAVGKPMFVGELGRQTQSAGGSLQARADIFGAKFAAQLGAGVDGILLWGWRNADQGGSALADYDIGPNDPALAHVRAN